MGSLPPTGPAAPGREAKALASGAPPGQAALRPDRGCPHTSLPPSGLPLLPAPHPARRDRTGPAGPIAPRGRPPFPRQRSRKAPRRCPLVTGPAARGRSCQRQATGGEGEARRGRPGESTGGSGTTAPLTSSCKMAPAAVPRRTRATGVRPARPQAGRADPSTPRLACRGSRPGEVGVSRSAVDCSGPRMGRWEGPEGSGRGRGRWAGAAPQGGPGRAAVPEAGGSPCLGAAKGARGCPCGGSSESWCRHRLACSRRCSTRWVHQESVTQREPGCRYTHRPPPPGWGFLGPGSTMKSKMSKSPLFYCY